MPASPFSKIAKKIRIAPADLVNQVDATETKLLPLYIDARRILGYALGVTVNGVNARLQLDSGAHGVLVNTKIAQKAGLTRIAESPIGGVGDKGSAQGYVAFASHLQIGELEFENCYVDVVDSKRSLTKTV